MLIDAVKMTRRTPWFPYLKQTGVTSLDYVIGTHPTLTTQAAWIRFDEFSVNWSPPLPPVEHTTRTFEDVLNSVSNRA